MFIEIAWLQPGGDPTKDRWKRKLQKGGKNENGKRGATNKTLVVSRKQGKWVHTWGACEKTRKPRRRNKSAAGTKEVCEKDGGKSQSRNPIVGETLFLKMYGFPPRDAGADRKEVLGTGDPAL